MPINYSYYHPKWSLIRRLVLRRAGHRCECCGASQRNEHPVTGSIVFLTIAHLDRDRHNNRFWNLAALCQRCHLIYDLNQRIFSARYGSETQYRNGKLFSVPVQINRNFRQYIPNYAATRRSRQHIAPILLFLDFSTPKNNRNDP